MNKKISKAPSMGKLLAQLNAHKQADQALTFVDEAATLLRGVIREGAATTDKSRIAAKLKAHNLLGKASVNLSKAIEDGTSVLQGFLKKI